MEAPQKGIGCSVLLVAVDEGSGSLGSLVLMVVLLAIWHIIRAPCEGWCWQHDPYELGPPSVYRVYTVTSVT